MDSDYKFIKRDFAKKVTDQTLLSTCSNFELVKLMCNSDDFWLERINEYKTDIRELYKALISDNKNPYQFYMDLAALGYSSKIIFPVNLQSKEIFFLNTRDANPIPLYRNRTNDSVKVIPDIMIVKSSSSEYTKLEYKRNLTLEEFNKINTTSYNRYRIPSNLISDQIISLSIDEYLQVDPNFTDIGNYLVEKRMARYIN